MATTAKSITLAFTGSTRKAIAARKALLYYFDLLGNLTPEQQKLKQQVLDADHTGQIVDSLTMKDALFIHGICYDMYKHDGIRKHSIAWQMLVDWSAELKNRAGLRGLRKKMFKKECL